MSNRAHNFNIILKLLSRLLPELYSTPSSYYYLSSQQRQPAYHNFKWSLNSQYLAIIGEFDWHNMPTRRYTDIEQKQQWNRLEFQGTDNSYSIYKSTSKIHPLFFNLHSLIAYRHNYFLLSSLSTEKCGGTRNVSSRVKWQPEIC